MQALTHFTHACGIKVPVEKEKIKMDIKEGNKTAMLAQWFERPPCNAGGTCSESKGRREHTACTSAGKALGIFIRGSHLERGLYRDLIGYLGAPLSNIKYDEIVVHLPVLCVGGRLVLPPGIC